MELNFKKETPAKKEISVETMMLSWPDCLYHESEAENRLALLAEAEKEGLTPEDNKIRRFLLDKRYTPGKVKGKPFMDNYLGLWLSLSYSSENISQKGEMKKNFRRDIEKKAAALGIGDVDVFGERGDSLLYEEFYQTGMLFINISLNDKMYGAVFLGFGKISDDKMAEKLAYEFLKAAYLSPKAVKFPKYELWMTALQQSYRDYFPDYADRLDQMIEKSGQ